MIIPRSTHVAANGNIFHLFTAESYSPYTCHVFALPLLRDTEASMSWAFVVIVL